MTADRNLIMSREIEAAPVRYSFRFVVAVGDFAGAPGRPGQPVPRRRDHRARIGRHRRARYPSVRCWQRSLIVRRDAES